MQKYKKSTKPFRFSSGFARQIPRPVREDSADRFRTALAPIKKPFLPTGCFEQAIDGGSVRLWRVRHLQKSLRQWSDFLEREWAGGNRSEEMRSLRLLCAGMPGTGHCFLIAPQEPGDISSFHLAPSTLLSYSLTFPLLSVLISWKLTSVLYRINRFYFSLISHNLRIFYFRIPSFTLPIGLTSTFCRWLFAVFQISYLLRLCVGPSSLW